MPPPSTPCRRWPLGPLVAVAVFGCAAPVSLDGRPCPCAAGYACRLADSTCVAAPYPERSDAPPRCTRRAPECSLPAGYQVDRFDSAQLGSFLIGRWLMCGDGLAERFGADFMGVEFAAGGEFYHLWRTADDECERGHGSEGEGRWKVFDISHYEGDGAFEVDVSLVGSGSLGAFRAAFSTDPLRLQYDELELVADPQGERP